ncbi:Nin one binding Zn-ribbon like-domain-containing protein [Massariosphaeria phaeospora]|uniref:20S-pre-rRNA D-site endonuclease NOB1 n=1 Tax=Massariosphaeria phaeospora TaxID=100035 RepID=A0A7C8M7W8_9PLEO|nr:Nin one binding Zn-ribbon like-domain-containing protein [Massariosphaeria phaeospora]
MAAQKPIHSLIIDTGPLIKNAVSISTIINQAEELYTTPAILSEIRDPVTRANVETTLLPFLTVKNPSPASYETVAAFSKKTGDFPVLSRQDLSILALAYEVHCKRHGGPVGLRDAPIPPPKKKPIEQKKNKQGNVESKAVDAEHDDFYDVPASELEELNTTESQPTKGGNDVDGPSESIVADLQPGEQAINDENTAGPAVEPAAPVDTEQNSSEDAANLKPSQEPTESAQAVQSLEKDLSTLKVTKSTPKASANTIHSSDEEEDDDGDWITPDNLNEHQAKDAGVSTRTTKQAQMSVATMTTDFAMQNVLLQMNLNLLSTNMQRIRNIRTYILRCHACFYTTKDMTKQFCPRCGQPTLTRVSCSTNAKGEFRIHLAKNYQYNNRGNRYSVPKPMHGSSNGKYSGKGGGKNGWGRELLLAEDQKEYEKQIVQEKKTKARDLMDEEYLPGILTGDRGREGGRPKVGAGRNINSKKRF